MADFVNLRRARKDKARRDREAAADANRRRFGRTRAQKAADDEAARRSEAALDARRLDPQKKD